MLSAAGYVGSPGGGPAASNAASSVLGAAGGGSGAGAPRPDRRPFRNACAEIPERRRPPLDICSILPRRRASPGRCASSAWYTRKASSWCPCFKYSSAIVSVSTGSACASVAVSAAPSSSERVTAAGTRGGDGAGGGRNGAGGVRRGDASSGMIRGKSICGDSSAASGTSGGGGASNLNMPRPSYCVGASPSTSTRSICCAFSSTSSWTSSPSAFAAAWAAGLTVSVPSNVSTSGDGCAAEAVGVASAASEVCSTTNSAFMATAGASAMAGFALAAFPLARASASAASPFIGSAESRRVSHSTAWSNRPLRSAISDSTRSAMMFSGSKPRTLANTSVAPASSFLSMRQRP